MEAGSTRGACTATCFSLAWRQGACAALNNVQSRKGVRLLCWESDLSASIDDLLWYIQVRLLQGLHYA
jgi:hypothetical protein